MGFWLEQAFSYITERRWHLTVILRSRTVVVLFTVTLRLSPCFLRSRFDCRVAEDPLVIEGLLAAAFSLSFSFLEGPSWTKISVTVHSFFLNATSQ
jgi:hypothetical protein